MPSQRLLLHKLLLLEKAVQSTDPCSGVLSQLVSSCLPARQKCLQPHQDSSIPRSGVSRHHSTLSGSSSSQRDLIRCTARLSSTGSSRSASFTTCTAPGSSSSSGSSSGSQPAPSSSSHSRSSAGGPVSASCDVPQQHVLHDLYRSRQQPLETSGSNTALYKLPSKIAAGSVAADEFQQEEHVLSRFYEEGVHGGLGRRFRRKVPLFQVIEFYANGTAIEEYKPRTPQQLGLHPRDVVLFAPLSRLAAPQRATIVVHEDKILVKTEIVKAIITPDKAVLIKGRRNPDTQKLAQNILAANDQRLMAISLFKQQQAAARAAATQQASTHGCSKAASAAQLLKAAELHGNPAAWEHLAEEEDATAASWGGSSDSSSSSSGSSSSVGSGLEGGGGFYGGDGVSSVLQRKRRKGGGALRGSRMELQDVPFGMLVLEVLLDATAEYFYTKVQHLNWMLESVAADIRQPNHNGDTDSQAAVDKAHQLLPIQKFLTSLKNDVKETGDAIKAALEDHDTLYELCESWQQQEQQRWTSAELQRRRARLALDYPGDAAEEEVYGEQVSMIYGTITNRPGHKVLSPNQQVRMMLEMLESYDREIQSLEGSINEAEEDLDNTRALWHMQMDSRRNHIIMVNLWLSMLNISVMATTVLPAFFGMNLDSGLAGDDPRFFVLVCGSSLCLSALAYPASRSWYNRNWRRINQNELFEQKMLRTILVQHIEDIDSIIRLVKHIRYKWIDRHAFRQLMMATLGSRVISPTHIDFLWQAYDKDRDEFIAEAEKIRPLNTYHSGTLSAVEGINLQHDLHATDPAAAAASSLAAISSTLAPAGYQQFLAQQSQILQPPGQQQQLQQQQPLPVDSWAGLMSESALNNLEELLRQQDSRHSSGSGGGSSGSSGGSSGSSRRPKSRGNWDEDWEGPDTSDDETPSSNWAVRKLGGWLRQRKKERQRRLSQLQHEDEQLALEHRLLERARKQEQQHELEQEQHWR